MTVAVGLGLMDFPFADARGFWRWIDLAEAEKRLVRPVGIEAVDLEFGEVVLVAAGRRPPTAPGPAGVPERRRVHLPGWTGGPGVTLHSAQYGVAVPATHRRCVQM